MKIVNIFVGSSITEMESDRKAFAEIISALNTKLREREYFFYLEKCEYEDGFLDEKETQKTIDEKMLRCNYAYFLIKTLFGKMTQHEFEIALEHFKKYGAPKLSVLFRKCEKEQMSEEAIQFQKRLEDMRYYYKEYKNTEELQLNIVLNLAVDDALLEKDLKAEDGGIYIGNTKLVDMESLPIYLKHTELLRLNEELVKLEMKERECEEKRQRRMIREEIQSVISKIHEIEKLVLQTMLGLTKATRGEMTPLLKRAIVYLEDGNVEKAAEILNVGDVLAELDIYQEKAELSLEGIQAAIETAYVAIESLQQLEQNVKRAKEIELLYEKIISLEEQYNLGMVHCGLYARHLLKNKKIKEAEKYILLYLEHADRRIETKKDFISCEYALFGLQLDIEELYKRNAEAYQKLYLNLSHKYIEVYEKALQKFETDINLNPYMLGILCDRTKEVIENWVGESDNMVMKRKHELEQKLERLKKIGYHKVDKSQLDGKRDAERLIDYVKMKEEFEKLNQEPNTDNPREYLAQYTDTMRSVIDSLQKSQNIYIQDNANFLKLIEEYQMMRACLENEEEEEIQFLYAQVKLGHADHFYNVANFKEAKKGYQKAYEHFKELAETEEEKYLYFFTNVCLNFASTLIQLEVFEEAERYMLEAISVREDMAKKNPNFRKTLLAKLYSNYVALCMRGRVYDCLNKGEMYSQKAIQIYEAYQEQFIANEKMDLVMAYHNYGMILLEHGKKELAADYFAKGAELYEN